jgi:hypothetical protein
MAGRKEGPHDIASQPSAWLTASRGARPEDGFEARLTLGAMAGATPSAPKINN